MTRRPCVSLTRLRKLQFHWKGSADVTYESFAAATVTVRHVESKITRNQDCFSRYVKDVCTRFAYRQPVTVFPLGGYVARSFYFFFFVLDTDAEERNSRHRCWNGENGTTIGSSQKERTGWKLCRCRCRQCARSRFYTRMTFDQSVQNKA